MSKIALQSFPISAFVARPTNLVESLTFIERWLLTNHTDSRLRVDANLLAQCIEITAMRGAVIWERKRNNESLSEALTSLGKVLWDFERTEARKQKNS